MEQELSVEVECESCHGSGVYSGYAEPVSVGVVCTCCKGTGKATKTYKAFTGRKTRTDVKLVRRELNPTDPLGSKRVYSYVSYEDFVAGKMP